MFGQNAGAAALSSAIAAMSNHLQKEFAEAETAAARRVALDRRRAVGDRGGRPQRQAHLHHDHRRRRPAAAARRRHRRRRRAGLGQPERRHRTAGEVRRGRQGRTCRTGSGRSRRPTRRRPARCARRSPSSACPTCGAARRQGKGFDCSGLTQWAYGKEGISLPHDAAAQNIGAAGGREQPRAGRPRGLGRPRGDVHRPRQMIEAPHTGDVVHIVPVRTTNAGDAFEGFFRPTA